MSGELPKGWAEATVADVVIPYQSIDPTKAPDKIFNYIDIGSIDNKTLKIIDYKTFFGSDAPSRARRIVRDGDTLFSTVRTYLRNIALARSEHDGFLTSTGIAVLRSADEIDPKYVFYAVTQNSFIEKISQKQDGTMYPAINEGDLGLQDILLPPAAEQTRIVEKIDALFERSRAAREELARIPKLIERYRQAVLEAAFRGDLTADWRAKIKVTPLSQTLAQVPEPSQSKGGREATDTVIPGVGGISVNNPETLLPDGWRWVPLRRVARQETGHTPSRTKDEYWGGDISWIGIKDANQHHGRIIQDTIQHITQSGLDNSSARLLPKGTVCLSRTASVGYVTIMGKSMATSQDFATWSCSQALDPFYLMYALLSEGDNIKNFGEGSTHTTIYFPEIRAFHIALAPLEEQREIVRIIQRSFAAIDGLRKRCTTGTERLSNLDQAILDKAFRGELVPQDPNDEPASVLLERIKAARAAAPAPRRGRRAKPAE